MDKRNDVLATFDRELTKIANNLAPVTKPPSPPREQHEFVALQKRAIESMIATHQDAVTEISNLLEEAKVAGAKMIEEIEERSAQLAELLERSKQFGASALDLCKEFHAQNFHRRLPHQFQPEPGLSVSAVRRENE
jgi:hypothetical protein